MTAPDTRVRVAALELANPLCSASGCFGYGNEFQEFFDPARLGAVVGKSITIRPRPGNPPPRVTETPSGMLNSIGLENVGADTFLAETLPGMQDLRERGGRVVVNLAGDAAEEYADMAGRLDESGGADALELNLSCPNVKEGGLTIGVSPDAVREVTAAVRGSCGLPLWVKLTPNVTDILALAEAALDGGADALTLINTYVGMAVDWRGRRAVLGRRTGGLSGPAIRPLAVRIVWQVASRFRCPIVAAGGAARAEDVLEFMAAGAHAVQMGTSGFADPSGFERVLERLPLLAAEAGYDSLAAVTGAALPAS